jgi:hypothetical protein
MLFSARLLGFDDYIPAFAGASNDQLLSGVNFASAAAGIRDETGQQLARARPQIFLLDLRKTWLISPSKCALTN